MSRICIYHDESHSSACPTGISDDSVTAETFQNVTDEDFELAIYGDVCIDLSSLMNCQSYTLSMFGTLTLQSTTCDKVQYLNLAPGVTLASPVSIYTRLVCYQSNLADQQPVSVKANGVVDFYPDTDQSTTELISFFSGEPVCLGNKVTMNVFCRAAILSLGESFNIISSDADFAPVATFLHNATHVHFHLTGNTTLLRCEGVIHNPYVVETTGRLTFGESWHGIKKKEITIEGRPTVYQYVPTLKAVQGSRKIIQLVPCYCESDCNAQCKQVLGLSNEIEVRDPGVSCVSNPCRIGVCGTFTDIELPSYTSSNLRLSPTSSISIKKADKLSFDYPTKIHFDFTKKQIQINKTITMTTIEPSLRFTSSSQLHFTSVGTPALLDSIRVTAHSINWQVPDRISTHLEFNSKEYSSIYANSGAVFSSFNTPSLNINQLRNLSTQGIDELTLSSTKVKTITLSPNGIRIDDVTLDPQTKLLVMVFSSVTLEIEDHADITDFRLEFAKDGPTILFGKSFHNYQGAPIKIEAFFYAGTICAENRTWAEVIGSMAVKYTTPNEVPASIVWILIGLIALLIVNIGVLVFCLTRPKRNSISRLDDEEDRFSIEPDDDTHEAML